MLTHSWLIVHLSSLSTVVRSVNALYPLLSPNCTCLQIHLKHVGIQPDVETVNPIHTSDAVAVARGEVWRSLWPHQTFPSRHIIIGCIDWVKCTEGEQYTMHIMNSYRLNHRFNFFACLPVMGLMVIMICCCWLCPPTPIPALFDALSIMRLWFYLDSCPNLLHL